MFANRQGEVEVLLGNNVEFRRLFNKHQELDKRVHEAEIGTEPVDDFALTQLKKQKLQAKDRMAYLLDHPS